MEIGPYRLKDAQTLEVNDGAWNEFANVLFVDNPVGTGFSYANTDSYVRELDDMADQFVTFLEKWFALFPEYEHDDVGTPWRHPLAFNCLTSLPDLYLRRVVRWPAHPLHREARTGPE